MDRPGGATSLPRHSLIDIDPRAWPAVLSGHPELADDLVVRTWADFGRPLIARRRGSGDATDRIAAGLPLPPSLGKRRLAFALPHTAITGIRPPPELTEVAGIAPPAWRATIDALHRFATTQTLAPRVYGSFAWAALTGLDYVGPGSDLDLLWPLDDSLPSLLDALATIEAAAPGRIDGEIVGVEGAVNWRELWSGAREVLVKTSDAVELVSRSTFLENRSH